MGSTALRNQDAITFKPVVASRPDNHNRTWGHIEEAVGDALLALPFLMASGQHQLRAFCINGVKNVLRGEFAFNRNKPGFDGGGFVIFRLRRFLQRSESLVEVTSFPRHVLTMQDDERRTHSASQMMAPAHESEWRRIGFYSNHNGHRPQPRVRGRSRQQRAGACAQ